MEEYDAFVREEGETESTLGGFSDPQSEITFVRSKLDWDCLDRQPHAGMLAFYRDLLAFRRAHPQNSNCDKSRTRVRFDEDKRWLTIERGDETGARTLLVCNLSAEPQPVPFLDGTWRLALWSGEARYGDALQPAPPERIEGEKDVELAGWGAALHVSES